MNQSDFAAGRQGKNSTVQLRWPAKFSEVPKEVFHREDVYRVELERIFYGEHWHMLCHRAEIPNPGDFKTTHIGEASILIVHGDDGRIRVFNNSCAHRGTQLKTISRGNSAEIECPYHRWIFNTRGDLLGAPGTGDFPGDFRKEAYGLTALRTAEYLGLIFATFRDSTPGIDEYLGETKRYVERALGDGRLKLLGYQKVMFHTNWKAYTDNCGYHGPLLHVAFRLLKLPASKGEQFITRHSHKINYAEFPPGSNTGFLNDFSVVEIRDTTTPPQNTVVNFFPASHVVRNLDIVNLRFGFPRAPDRTEAHYAYFAHQDDDAEMLRHRIRQGSNLIGPSGFVSLEDGAVFNRVQAAAGTAGTVEFQKGVTGRIEAPCLLERASEAGNLIRWEYYRELMGFERD